MGCVPKETASDLPRRHSGTPKPGTQRTPKTHFYMLLMEESVYIDLSCKLMCQIKFPFVVIFLLPPLLPQPPPLLLLQPPPTLPHGITTAATATFIVTT